MARWRTCLGASHGFGLWMADSIGSEGVSQSGGPHSVLVKTSCAPVWPR